MFKQKMTKTAGKPIGFYGMLMLQKMNLFHTRLSFWGLTHLSPQDSPDILEIGVGGGKNIKRIFERFPKAKLWGIDISSLAIKRAKLENIYRYLRGKVSLSLGNVSALPYKEEAFDKVLAFETIYYWSDLKADFSEVYRVLKPEGEFLICNEDYQDPDRPHEHDALKALLPITIYENETVIAALHQAGFKKVTLWCHHNGDWVSFLAKKY